MTLERKIMETVGSEFGGSDAPPFPRPLRYVTYGGKRIIRVDESSADTQVIASNNDGFELWFGWGDRWTHHMRQEEVRALFWRLLWEWYAKARWFGLRRPIYYWALHREVERMKRIPKVGQ